MFEAVILAGGQGTRLKSVTGSLPKPMVLINNQPFLYILMKRLESHGCRKIILSLSYRSEYIIKRINSDKPVSCQVDFSVEDSPLGTGGALKYASKLVSDDKFLSVNGDTLCGIDYRDMLTKADAVDLLISGVSVEDASRYGTLNIDKNNNIISFNEKGISGQGIINSGSYVITTDQIMKYPKDHFSFEQDYISNFEGVFKVYYSNGYFIDIGIPADYYSLCNQVISPV